MIVRWIELRAVQCVRMEKRLAALIQFINPQGAVEIALAEKQPRFGLGTSVQGEKRQNRYSRNERLNESEATFGLRIGPLLM